MSDQIFVKTNELDESLISTHQDIVMYNEISCIVEDQTSKHQTLDLANHRPMIAESASPTVSWL